MKTKMVFNAELQKETPHTISLNPNGDGEIIFTCTETGRAIKAPAGLDKDGIEAFLKAHKEANIGQVSMEGYQKEEQALIDLLSDSEVEEPVAPVVEPTEEVQPE